MSPHPPFVWSEVNFHDIVMTFQFFQLTLCGFIIVYTIVFAILAVPLTNEPKTPISSRIDKIPCILPPF